MSSEIQFDLEDEPIDEVDQQELQKERADLHEKLKGQNIESSIKSNPDGDSYVEFFLPNGREKRRVVAFNKTSIQTALKLDFSSIVFLGEYEAIADNRNSTIEAIIRPMVNGPSNYLYSALLGKDEEGKERKAITIAENENGGATIEISSASAILRFLSREIFLRPHTLSLKISGISISQHNKSLEILQRVSDSLFFQIDLKANVIFNLVRRRAIGSRVGRRRITSKFELDFPKTEYDESPISLYWYARSATGMPLLQFLAFYQVVEYYYSSYSQEEAKKRIRSILKDPTFRYDRDADIGKVLSTLTISGKGFGDERSQLKATLGACVDATELRQFFEETEERISFFTNKQKGLTDFKIPIATKDADLRNATADLIYDIRCKVVHSKGDFIDGEVELILPNSKEADVLISDIELVQFIARKVLISASSVLIIKD